MNLEGRLRDIRNGSFTFEFRGLTITIDFSYGWTYSHRIAIEHGGRDIGYWTDLKTTRELLKKMERGDLEKILTAWSLGSTLSWRSGSKFLEKLLKDDWEGMLKTAYFSLLAQGRKSRYLTSPSGGLHEAEAVKKTVKKGLGKGYFKRNKWVEKLEKIEEILRWKRILGRKGS